MEAAETKRYMQLVNWLWEIGVCWRCRHAIAAAQVDKETTGTDAKVSLDCSDSAQCRELAKRGWLSMPAKESC
jgi:hypothetical protein